MKRLIKISMAVAAGAACIYLCACGSGREPTGAPPGSNIIYGTAGSFEYNSITENGFTSVAEEASSYFSLARNTATYSLIRRQITDGRQIQPDSVRIEEMINYFDYDFTAPTEKALAVSSYIAPCPWNNENMLMLAGIKSAKYCLDGSGCNYVFLIDVSGSMQGGDRIDLAKYGICKLVDNLEEGDIVSLVTYASGVNTVFDGKECTEENKEYIKNKVNGLRAYGATNGGDGLERAYGIAQSRFIEGGNNRIVLISDGDFNVGMSSQTELKEFIQTKAESGIYLSVLGVGMGNTRDSVLETLAKCGNGSYAYLDNKTEAEKVFVTELEGTLKTVAKDAKAGVTFTDAVEKYRLIGYDTVRLSQYEFEDENTDAGEIGSNLCVAALYEIKLSDGTADGAKLAETEIRFKDVRGENALSDSVKSEVYLNSDTASDDLTFISCVAEFGLLLRESAYKGEASVESVAARLDTLSGYIAADALKQEFANLVKKML